MMMLSVILDPLATSSPLTAYLRMTEIMLNFFSTFIHLMVRSGQKRDILPATSPICKASS